MSGLAVHEETSRLHFFHPRGLSSDEPIAKCASDCMTDAIPNLKARFPAFLGGPGGWGRAGTEGLVTSIGMPNPLVMNAV